MRNFLILNNLIGVPYLNIDHVRIVENKGEDSFPTKIVPFQLSVKTIGGTTFDIDYETRADVEKVFNEIVNM